MKPISSKTLSIYLVRDIVPVRTPHTPPPKRKKTFGVYSTYFSPRKYRSRHQDYNQVSWSVTNTPLPNAPLNYEMIKGWTVGRKDRRLDGRTDERTVGRMDGRTVGRMDGRTDGRTEVRTDGRTDGRAGGGGRIKQKCIIISYSTHFIHL